MPASEAFYAKVTLGSRICKETVAAASDTIPPEEEAACQLGGGEGGTDVCGWGEKKRPPDTHSGFPSLFHAPLTTPLSISFSVLK